MNQRAINIRWIRLMGGICLAGTTLWWSGATAVWVFARLYRGMADVRYMDVLLPTRWANYRRVQGDHHIAEARHLLASRDPNQAVFKLRAGLARSPANVDGRLLLARLCVAGRRPDQAREVLTDGLRHLPNNLGYLHEVLQFHLDHQLDAEAEALCARLLADAPGGGPRGRLLALVAATAAFNRGHYDRAEALIETHRLHATADGLLLQARLDWERGYRDLALQRFESAPPVNGPQAETMFVQLARCYRALGRLADVERSVTLRLAANPLSASPRIELLHVHHARRDHARLERETEVFLENFANDPAALVQLADFAANTGRPALAERVHALCLARGHPEEGPALTTIEACLVAGQPQAALDRLSALTQAHPDWPAKYSVFFLGLRAVALHALGKTQEADAQLDQLLTQKNLRAELLLSVSQRLLSLGAKGPARTVLTHAAESDPSDQAALAPLVSIELETDPADTLPAHLPHLLKTRKPPRAILQAACRKIGSDLCLFHPDQPAMLAALQSALAAAPPAPPF